jgi:hypothetical protein
VARAKDKVDYYTQRIEANPEDAKSYFHRAQSFQCLGQRKRANADVTQYSVMMNQGKAFDFTVGAVTNLGPAINTSAFESIAGVSVDGLSFFFLRILGDRSREVWVSRRATTEDAWEVAVFLGSLWNISSTCSSVGFLPGITTADGLEVYHDAELPGGYGWSDLYVRKREKIRDIWGPLENLGTPPNSAYQESHACVSPDGLELFFSGIVREHARPGGCGGADLWVTRRATRSDPWAEPENLGPTINSPHTDARPSISADGLLLFFDSSRPGGYGSIDLYVIKRSATDAPWTSPINLGPVVNTPAIEECARISTDKSTLYWDSDRPGGHGDNDLWQVTVRDLDNLAGPNAEDRAVGRL